MIPRYSHRIHFIIISIGEGVTENVVPKSMAPTIIDSEIVSPNAILLFLNISTRTID
jgi:hypothetical protein